MSQTNPKYKRLESLLSGSRPANPDPVRTPANEEVEALRAQIAKLEAEKKQLQQPPEESRRRATAELKTQPVPPPANLAGGDQARMGKESSADAMKANAFRITLIGLPASIIAASFYLYLAFTTGAWQLYAWSADIGLLALVVLISMILIRRGRVSLGVWLMLAAVQVTFVGAVALIQGIGLLVGVSIAILVSIIAGQALSEKATGRASILGVVSGVAALLLDFFGPAYRLPQPEPIRVFLPGILGAVILLYGIVTVRQFRNYSLRTKLLLGFLGVLILSSLIGVFSVQQQFRTAEQTAVTEASNVADVVSGVVTQNQTQLQDLVTHLHESQQRDVEVLGPDLRIVADAIPEDVGTIFDADQNGKVAATLKDGQPRTFVEISPDYPQGINQVVVPIKDEYTGTITGAVLLDYTQTLQQASFSEADNFAKQISVFIANDPATLQDFISNLYVAQHRDMVVVDAQKRILAGTVPGSAGTLYTRDLRGEVAATLNDGQPRTFVEISVDHPSGIQQVVTPIRDPAGNIIGAAILGPTAHSEEMAIDQAYQVAEAVGVAASENQGLLQEIVNQLHKTQQRDVEVVGPDLRIIADAVPEGVGTIFDADRNGEVAATLKDGQPRTFVEVSADYPQGVRQLVVPVRDASGKIIAATILDYTPLYTEVQQTANTTVRTLIFLSLAVLLVAFVISQIISASIANPISRLREAALKIGGGQLDTPVPALSSKDEVGVLAGTLQNMTAQLRGLIGSLEQRVAERTQDLEVAAEVARAVGEKTADLYGLLKDAVELIAEQFHLYYTQIYLADPTGRTLILRAGSGEVGMELLRRGHHLPVGSGSINGRAAAERNPIIVADTSQSSDFKSNPLLPDTRSEMSIPLIAGGKVLGVLDMQSRYADALNETNLTALEALAGQLAIAVQNAALFADAEQSRAELEAYARRLVRTGWSEYLNAIQRPERTGYVYDQNGITPIADAAETRSPGGHTLTAPIAVTGEPLGTFSVELEKQTWGTETAEFVNSVARQVSQQIENLRLLESAQQYRSEAENAVRRLTREGWDVYQQSRNEQAPGYEFDLNEVRPLAGNSDGKSSDVLKYPLIVRDEAIGELAVDSVINSSEAAEIVAAVAQQLSGHIENLRLTEQNEERAHELETVADVSATTATLLDPDRLLQTVVDVTKERFGVYHVHIYLVDESWGALLLAAGAGEVGRKMVAEEHAIALDAEKSLVARAARERTAAIVNNVHSDPGFLPNPLLPKTQSEMAVPMIVGEKVIGVFDVQSETVNSFSEEDAYIYTTLAAQVAVALQNARLYAEQAATVTQLRELDRLKSSFLANMSHELRTPLNSILGFTDVMLEQIDGPLSDNMNSDLQLIQKNGQHLLNLINDVLDMAKIEAGKMNLNPERFKVHEILEEVVSITSPLASEKSLSLFIEDDSDHEVDIFADRTRIRQVMLNLVNNAMKFTEEGRISLHVGSQDEHVLIRVKDTGIGIPTDKLESVFQEFAQVDTSATRKVGGTGLGLPISRRLIEMHGGRLWAESTGIPGEGSTFYVELPVEAKITEPVERLEK